MIYIVTIKKKKNKKTRALWIFNIYIPYDIKYLFCKIILNLCINFVIKKQKNKKIKI